MSEAHEKTRIRQLEDAAAHWEHKYGNARQYNRNLEARIRELEAALREADCPHPINGAGVMLEDHTVGLCVKLGYCGCGNAALLAADRGGEPHG